MTEDIGNEVSAQVERLMKIITYVEWRKYRANVRTALVALVDMGITFNMLTVLHMAGVSACSPIDIYIEREISQLAEQQVVRFEIAGLWWNSYKGVA